MSSTHLWVSLFSKATRTERQLLCARPHHVKRLLPPETWKSSVDLRFNPHQDRSHVPWMLLQVAIVEGHDLHLFQHTTEYVSIQSRVEICNKSDFETRFQNGKINHSNSKKIYADGDLYEIQSNTAVGIRKNTTHMLFRPKRFKSERTNNACWLMDRRDSCFMGHGPRFLACWCHSKNSRNFLEKFQKEKLQHIDMPNPMQTPSWWQQGTEVLHTNFL